MRQARFERATFGSGGGNGQRQPGTAPLLPPLLPRVACSSSQRPEVRSGEEPGRFNDAETKLRALL